MPGNDSVMVTYGGMEAAASGFNSSAGRLAQTIEDLDAQLNTLLSTFTGNTASAFAVNKQQLDAGYAQMRLVVSQLSNVISEATANYQAADNAAANLFH